MAPSYMPQQWLKISIFASLAMFLILFHVRYFPSEALRSHDFLRSGSKSRQHQEPISTSHESTSKSSFDMESSHQSSKPKSKYAYATFLNGKRGDGEDHYFVGARVLTYQLLHAPSTKTTNNIPFIVVATRDVTEIKLDALRRDGATVVVVDDVVSPWILETGLNPSYKDVMTKFRLWEMVEYERICFLDSDHILTANMDAVFDHPLVKDRTTGNNTEKIKDDEAELPEDYVMVSTAEMEWEHGFPPTEKEYKPHYMNAGFFVIKPSIKMFKYYSSLLNIKDGRWEAGLPEQNLMNYAHRPDGNMPWQRIGHIWNIHYPTVKDMESGVKSLHGKFWGPLHGEIKPHLEKIRWKMEGYWEGRNRKPESYEESVEESVEDSNESDEPEE